MVQPLLLERVPVIDLHQEETAIVTQLDQALQQFGFFYVQNHDISSDLIQEQFEISRQLFDLPMNVKQTMPFDATFDIGYLAAGGQALEKTLLQPPSKDNSTPETTDTEQVDTKEQFMMTNNKLITASSTDDERLVVDPQDVFEGSKNYNLAPYIPHHPKVTSAYMSAAYQLNLRLQHYLFQSLQLPKSQCSILGQHPFLVLKQMKYAGPPSDPSMGRYGAGPHTDWGSFTILVTDQQPGLQIHVRNQWLDVPPIANTLIINAGDQIACLTNHYYQSALHRVVVKSSTHQVRYSTAVFAYYGMDAKFGPLPQFCSADPTTDTATSREQRDLSKGRTTRQYFHYKLHQSVYGKNFGDDRDNDQSNNK